MLPYWSDPLRSTSPHGIELSFAGNIALKLVESWGLVTGKISGEDTGGRAILAPMPVPEVVQRACDLAAEMVFTLEQRGWIRPATKTPEELSAEAGRLERIRTEHSWALPRREILENREKASKQ